jgi:hypothetical protein
VRLPGAPAYMRLRRRGRRWPARLRLSEGKQGWPPIQTRRGQRACAQLVPV